MYKFDITAPPFKKNIHKVIDRIQIHADLTENSNGYPTHTHGMGRYALPELLINASAFGARGNGIVLNGIAAVLLYELDLPIKFPLKIQLWPENSGTFIVKMVDSEFRAVKSAYPDHDNSTSFAQIYVEGDDHVLEDNFYRIHKLQPRRFK